MWHRRRYYRRRRRVRRPSATLRRRVPRRRRLWIRRPIGGIYTTRMTKSGPLNITFSGSSKYSLIQVSFPLSEFQTVATFDYYRILGASWTIRPAVPTTIWPCIGGGLSIIDLDNNVLPNNPTSMPWGNNSTARYFQSQYGTSRYFKPKPQVKSAGSESSFFPANTRNWWWNTSLSNTDWGYIKAGFYSGSATTYQFYQTKRIYVQFKTLL
ncbi:capsid protein [Banfec circovirus 1]|uniref:capsid protein n=1 Tax=Banfec circovirus 1 TaxID=3038663 RepID=UPI00401181F7|nr:capsid protein [Banfec circovirus 1]